MNYSKNRICGIYCITNKINGKKYIGQSIDIKSRWKAHKHAAFNSNTKSVSYNYPLYIAMRKYGLDNFEFSILEQLQIEDSNILNEREIYWISTIGSEYNQTKGGSCTPSLCKKGKLNPEIVYEIQQILINDKQNEIRHKDLARNYGVSKDTIQAINVGRTWYNSSLEYPLHYSKFDNQKPDGYYIPKNNKCSICNKSISPKAKLCLSCYKSIRYKSNLSNLTKKELQELIYKYPFTKIGEMFGVTDSAIRKWCKKYNLPYKYSELHKKDSTETVKTFSNIKRPVKATSIILNQIKYFDSISEASNWIKKTKGVKSNIGGIRGHISAVCKNKRKTAYGYNWEYI